MSRQPIPGSDNGTWGYVLNDYLSQSIGMTGTLLPSAVAAAFVFTSVQTGNYGPGTTQSECVLTNASSGSITITLPSAASNINFYTVKKTDSSSNTVTLATTSAQTIDGSATAIIKVPYVAITVVSDGSNWNII